MPQTLLERDPLHGLQILDRHQQERYPARNDLEWEIRPQVCWLKSEDRRQDSWLTKALAVSRTTVATAYALLRQEGWIESHQGSGTRVLRRGNANEMATKHDHLLEPSRKRARPLLQHEKMLSTIDFSLAAPAATPAVTHVLASLIKDEGNELTTGQGYLWSQAILFFARPLQRTSL